MFLVGTDSFNSLADQTLHSTEMNKHVINNNSSLADFMTYFIEASGLQERIAEIVKDAIAASLPSSQKQQDNSEDSSYYTRSELC